MHIKHMLYIYVYIYIFIIISMCVDVLEQFSVLSDTCKPLCTSNHKMLLFGCCFFLTDDAKKSEATSHKIVGRIKCHMTWCDMK